MHFSIYLFVVILWCGVLTSGNVIIANWQEEVRQNSLKLGDSVDEIVENLLGYNDFQEYYDTLSFSRRELDGSEILENMATNFGQKFSDRNEAIKHLQGIVEESLTSSSYLRECCSIDETTLEHDDRFKQKIGNKGCQRISSLSTDSSGYLSKRFEEACAENLLRMPFLRWQYYASESGITSLYPAIKVDDCGSYDARFRPFYVQANVPEAKDVVIVIDKSGSMSTRHRGVTLMEIAKNAAKTVVATLNPHDRVAVIGFSSSIVAMGTNNEREKCFSEQLALATEENVEALNNFIDEITASGGTHYGLALSKAFDYFDNTPVVDERDRVILFLSDGVPTDKTELQATGNYIFTILNERNSRVNNSVVLMTYGISGADSSILEHMAEQDGNTYGVENTELESIKAGLFTRVAEASNLRQKMGSYYQFFSKRTAEPIWSLPYLDKWGIGLLMSVTLPVYDGGNLAGVVGTDLTLDDFLSDAVYFRSSELSYIFIIDEYGYVIYHPYFKYPEDHGVKYIDISAFETDPNMLSVVEDMKSGGKGSRTFKSERVAPGGSSKLYGVTTFTVTTEVYWKQIPHSKFSLCVVLAKDDEESSLQQVDPHHGDEFLYHRLDVVAPDNPCKHYDNYCALNQSSVTLGPRTFVNPDGYLNDKETSDTIKTIENYMISGRGGSLLKPGIRNSVWATQQAERFWTTHAENELERYVMWRYVGTKEGFLRNYPGTQLPKNYDPTVRPWYLNAMAHRGQATFSLPYKDAASGEYIISISKAVYEGKANGVHNDLKDEVVAVMSADMLVPVFKLLLNETFPMCSEKEMDISKGEVYSYRCTLIDSAGFVMFGNTLNNYNSAFPDHITEIEPRIAESLLEHNIMTHSECMVMEETNVQRTYRIVGTESALEVTNRGCDTYLFIPIPGTNIYMINARGSSTCSNVLVCPCSKFISNGNRKCSASSGTTCECPCTTLYEDYNTCVNKYNYTGSISFPKPCQPSPKPLLEVGKNERGIQNLPQCTKYGGSSSSNNNNSDTSDISGAIIAGIVVGAIVVILIIVAVIVLAKRGAARPRSVRRPTQDPLPNRPSIPSAPPMFEFHPPPYDEGIYVNASTVEGYKA